MEVSCRTSVWFQASIQFRLQVLSGFQRQSSPDTHTCTLYCITVCVCVCMSLSRGQLFVTPWTVAHQAPLSIGFSRQEYYRSIIFPATPSYDFFFFAYILQGKMVGPKMIIVSLSDLLHLVW